MIGYILAIISGAAMSLQGVMNTRLGEKIGFFASNAYVQGTAFIVSLITLFFAKDTNIKGFSDVNKFYLFGGLLGLIITLTVMFSIKNLSPAAAIATILISQLICAGLIDAFGVMDTPKVSFGWNKYLGIVIMITGIIIFKKAG